MTNTVASVSKSVLSSLWTHGWTPNAGTKQFSGPYVLTGGMFINWEQAINWSSYDAYMDVNEVSTTSSLLSAGLTQYNAHDPQVCVHYLRSLALYKQLYPQDGSYDGQNPSGYMSLSQMVDHVTLCDFIPKTSSTQAGNKGYSNPKGWVYFALLDCYLNLQNSPLLTPSQVAALKSSTLYAAWTYYNVFYDATIPILCDTSHTPHTYQLSQSLFMAAALLDAANRFPSDITTGMFYSATGATQSAALWQTAATNSIPSTLNRGGWDTTYNLFASDMTIVAGAGPDAMLNNEGKVGDEAEAAISLIKIYQVTGTSSYLTQAQTLLESIESKCVDTTNGGYFFAFYVGGDPLNPPGLSNAYKESRANAHMLWAYYLYNQISPIYTAREAAIRYRMLNNFYKTFGDSGFWYRTDATASFAAYVDKYVNPFSDTLYAQASAGATSIQVHTDINLGNNDGLGRISLIFEPRTTNEEELNFAVPPTAQGTSTTIDQDTFVRANQSAWGTASGASVWTELSGTGVLSIVSNQGNLGKPAGTNTPTVLQLGSLTAVDLDVKVRFSVGSLADRPGLLARMSGTNTYYEVQLVNTGTGLKLTKTISGTQTTLLTGTPGGQQANGLPNFAIVPGNFYWLRFRVQGSNLAVKCWQDGASEQSPYDVQAVDTSITATGGFGVIGLCTTATNDTYDSFSVSTIPLPYLITVDALSNNGTGQIAKTHAIGAPIQSLTFPNNNVETQYTTEAMAGVLVYLLLTNRAGTFFGTHL